MAKLAFEFLAVAGECEVAALHLSLLPGRIAE